MKKETGRKMIFIILFLVFILQAFQITFSPSSIRSSPISGVTADWGDVVNVNSSLWLDVNHTIEVPGNIGLVLDYVYLRRSQTEQVPPEVYQALPMSAAEKLSLVYLQAFTDEIIGMHVNEEKSFMIAAAEAYGDKDLFYNVTLLAIVYDSSATTRTSDITSVSTSSIQSYLKSTTIESSTILPNITSFPDGFFTILLFFASFIMIKVKRRNKNNL
ncbi:MAG: hypothetical protein ACFFDT_00755 [Candidatus Hodarchaeota archaeon]